uniref:Helitron_like_N domain-containing protein n=1 Tax=Parastrongyloides trichosuri TaxID=131310 RepID=A0A0N4ZL14_PARTI
MFVELSNDDFQKLRHLLADTKKYIAVTPFLSGQNVTPKWHILLEHLPDLAVRNEVVMGKRIVAFDTEESIESLHSICNNYSKVLLSDSLA